MFSIYMLLVLDDLIELNEELFWKPQHLRSPFCLTLLPKMMINSISIYCSKAVRNQVLVGQISTMEMDFAISLLMIIKLFLYQYQLTILDLMVNHSL